MAHAGRTCLLTLAVATALWLAPSAALAQVYLGAPVNFPAADGPSDIAVGEFNGDGDRDLVVVHTSPDLVTVLLGGAGASFSAPAPFAATSGPAEVAVGDFDGDGDADLAVAGANGVAVLLGNGAGGFSPQTVFPAGGPPSAIAVGDFNGDSDLDLVVANRGAGEVSVLTGGTGGTFSAPTSFPVVTGGLPESVAVADFNADGDPDVAVASTATDNLTVLLGATGASFGLPMNFTVGDFPQSVAVGDFNADGDPDLATANFNSANASVLLGGPGPGASFFGLTSIPAGPSPIAVATGDFNADSDPDLAISNRDVDTVSVLLGGAGGAFSGPLAFAAGDGPQGVAVGDFDLDGRDDLAVANANTDSVSVLANPAPAPAPTPPTPVTPLAPPLAAAPPDRDADTIPDAGDNCVDTPNPPQADRDADGIGDACDASDASAGPTLGRSVVARVVSGEVFVRVPGRSSRSVARAAQVPTGFAPLKGAEILPVGTVVHATRGRLALTSAATQTRTQRAEFYRGIFQIRQRRARLATTDIALRSTNYVKECGSAARAGRAAGAFDVVSAQARRRSKKVISRLWGNGKGRFRTIGRHSAATLRGTIWLTEERCDGTLTRVTRGVVSVRDLRARRTVTVRAGRSYLARATRAAAKTRPG